MFAVIIYLKVPSCGLCFELTNDIVALKIVTIAMYRSSRLFQFILVWREATIKYFTQKGGWLYEMLRIVHA